MRLLHIGLPLLLISCARYETPPPAFSTSTMVMPARPAVEAPARELSPFREAEPRQLLNSQEHGYGFAYAPTIVEENGMSYAFFCSSGGATSSGWDVIRLSKSTDGIHWSPPNIVLDAADGTTSSDRATCDPTVVRNDGYFYLYYTGAPWNPRRCENSTSPHCASGAVFLARSESLEGPYEKFMGRDLTGQPTWSLSIPGSSPANPQPILSRRDIPFGPGAGTYGAGQFSVMALRFGFAGWFYDDAGTAENRGRVFFVRSLDGISWTDPVPTNVVGAVSPEVRQNGNGTQYLMFHFAGQEGGHHEKQVSIVARASVDGIHWSAATELFAPHPRTAFAHNLGVNADSYGRLVSHRAVIAYGAVPDRPACRASIGSCWADWNLDALVFSLAPVPVHRAYDPGLQRHYFTADAGEHRAAVHSGYVDESPTGPAFFLYPNAGGGTRRVRRLVAPGRSVPYYTVSDAETDLLLALGWKEGTGPGYLFPHSAPGAVPIYHLYNRVSGDHLFTSSHDERTSVMAHHPEFWEEHGLLGYGPNL